ncbi:unnamed protein product [Caretta caretta]
MYEDVQISRKMDIRIGHNFVYNCRFGLMNYGKEGNGVIEQKDPFKTVQRELRREYKFPGLLLAAYLLHRHVAGSLLDSSELQKTIFSQKVAPRKKLPVLHHYGSKSLLYKCKIPIFEYDQEEDSEQEKVYTLEDFNDEEYEEGNNEEEEYDESKGTRIQMMGMIPPEAPMKPFLEDIRTEPSPKGPVKVRILGFGRRGKGELPPTQIALTPKYWVVPKDVMIGLSTIYSYVVGYYLVI